MRRSFDRAAGRSALHLISAWGCKQRLVLGQAKVREGSNEIDAMPGRACVPGRGVGAVGNRLAMATARSLAYVGLHEGL